MTRCSNCGCPTQKTAWTLSEEPLCPQCVIHLLEHLDFDPRCAMCQMEVMQARRETKRLLGLQKTS